MWKLSREMRAGIRRGLQRCHVKEGYDGVEDGGPTNRDGDRCPGRRPAQRDDARCAESKLQLVAREQSVGSGFKGFGKPLDCFNQDVGQPLPQVSEGMPGGRQSTDRTRAWRELSGIELLPDLPELH